MTNRRKKLLAIILSLAMVAIFANIGLAQVAGKGETKGPQAEVPKTTLTGKIVFMKDFGGYVLITHAPHEEYKILNENKKILSQLAKEGKNVTVEGTLPRGAYLLQIDKVDGKNYP